MAKTYGNPITFGGGTGGQNADLPPLLDNFKASVPVEGIPVKDMPVGTKIKVPVNADYQSFLGENIVWLLADQNHAGYPENSTTICSKNGLMDLAFDAKEVNNLDEKRKINGNNRYLYSNRLQWMNSDKLAGKWYESKHTYDAPPISENLSSERYGYNDIDGFLAMLNPVFVSHLMETTLITERDEIDGGGTENVIAKIFDASAAEVGFNSVYTDGVPFPLFDSGNNLILYPTQSAVDNFPLNGWEIGKRIIWFLRSAATKKMTFVTLGSSYVMAINTNGTSYANTAWANNMGFRPFCNISNETLLSPEPDSDGCYTLAELAPVTLAESENYSVTLSADKMEEIRAEQLAGAVWVYGDHSPANVNDGTKIQLTREECITPSLEGEDVSVNRAIPWSKTKDFYARQFTYNSKKQYQTMLEGALASVIVEGAPAQVTDLVVSGSGATATLTWVNPVDDPVYTETVVVQKVGSAPSDITDGTEIYRGTDQTCTATGLEQSTDYYFAVYTLNSLGIYGQPVVSDVYRYDFPAEPTSWSEVTKLTNSQEYVFPETGWFKVVAVAGGGNGGKDVRKLIGASYGGAAGGGGGTGGISVSKISVKDIDNYKISVEFSEKDIAIKNTEISMSVTSGGDGADGYAEDDPGFYVKGGKGGDSGTASGGNLENKQGNTGSDGDAKKHLDTSLVDAPGGNPGNDTIYDEYRSTGGVGGGVINYRSDGKRTDGSDAYVVILRGNTNEPLPSQASTLSLLPTDSTLTVDWENSGDPVQTGTMLVYDTNHVPTSANDGVSVDIPVAQTTVSTFTVDGEEQQADNKKQSYTITGLSNNKPVYVALFPYDANKKYGIPKTDAEIPRAHSWYDEQQELKQEVQEATEQAEEAQETVFMTRDFLPDVIALTMPQIYDEWDPNSKQYTGKDKATTDKPASIVRRNEQLYRCLQSHTSQENWKPETSPSLWVEIADPALEWPEWKQPTGAHDAYAQGAKVTHNGKKWTSNVENNVWEPGVFGWDEVVE